MRKKKRLQMQRRPDLPLYQEPANGGQHPQVSRSLPANMEELEQQHTAWLARRGNAYISLAETARLWNRTPEQIIRWEQIADEHGN